MTSGELHTKTEPQRYWLDTPQLFLFTSSIILLSVLNFFHSSIEIKRPVVLLAASVFALFNLKKSSRFSVIAKVVLLYIIEMFFNQLSGRVVHVRSYSIHLPLIALIVLAGSFIFSRFQKSKLSPIETNGLLKSWVVVFAVIVLHMLLLFLFLKKIYGYGYDRNFGVLANMCLYFLVFVFSWEQLKRIHLRRIAAIVLTVFFIVIMARGF